MTLRPAPLLSGTLQVHVYFITHFKWQAQMVRGRRARLDLASYFSAMEADSKSPSTRLHSGLCGPVTSLSLVHP